ncbi:MAG: 4-hydroxy-tetrahydrodipicolinate reductase, partial [Clostridia bacterium]|nr:4-hydroxy-tetrahydrodipicolinate reductase [Clostridia bacterium]
RDIFAEGAIKAARFVFERENGFYTIEDLIVS